VSDLKLKVAFWDYDRTRALADGTVKLTASMRPSIALALFQKSSRELIRQREFDASELRLTYYLRTLDFDDPPFIALPVFPNRSFRHSAIYVNVASGIKEPQDLA
jgi:hypothetical protein